MALRQNLSQDDIQNLFLDSDNEEEVVLGDELEDEPHEIIPTFATNRILQIFKGHKVKKKNVLMISTMHYQADKTNL